LSTLVFSIDGTDQKNYEKYRVGGNFDLAIENVKKAVEAKKSLGHGPLIIFKYIIFKHTEMYLDQARQMALGLGVDRFQVNECNLSPQSSPETVKKFIPCGSNATSRISYLDYENNLVIPTEHFDSQYCTTPLNKPYIQVDGVVQPCCAAYKPGFFKKCVSDKDVEDKNTWDQRFNLLEKSLEEIWQDPWMNDFRVGALSNRHQMDSCRYCLMPTNSINHIFTHSILESKHIYNDSSNILDFKNFMIDIDDIKHLINENLDDEIKYYISSNSLTDDAKDYLKNSRYSYSN
jgi:MoaA/NifB/PqqE/SkfB family radical SAM enzyme